ncbi:MAG: hypothetical protein J6X99_03760 [Bacteroidales bacterium]|nr:hypothetical protein [Bacteroidales bacterium]
MKKIIIIFAAAVMALCACSKGYTPDSSYDVVGGKTSYKYSAGRTYMMCIVDDLMACALEDLEIAIKEGKTSVNWASRFNGMEITKEADDKWQLTFSNPLTIGGSLYDTTFKMMAERIVDQQNNGHANWVVEITGSRIEQKGYRCTFESIDPISFNANGISSGWNDLHGTLSMNVYEKDKIKDRCLLTMDGRPSDATFMRGL